MSAQSYYVLSLDGGGSKGIYTLGILNEIQAMVKTPLHKKFNLIYGTSTGSIIAALIGLGENITSIKRLYMLSIPKIMRHKNSWCRTMHLRAFSTRVFGDKTFRDLKTDVGLVATHVDQARPMIFKTNRSQAYSLKDSWQPGFGCTIADAVLASSAAFPFFRKVRVKTLNQGSPLLLDGGYVANNPTLFAMLDAVHGFKIKKSDIHILSLGTGKYREPSRNFMHEVVLDFFPFWLARKTFDASSNTLEILREKFFAEIDCVRISETFAEKDYETDLLESDPEKLEKLFQLGRKSVETNESKVRLLLGI